MSRFTRLHKRKPGIAGHRGIAAVELALCAPLLITLAFGMIETCNLMHTKTRMAAAAYDAARLATRPATASSTAATSSTVNAYAASLLQQLKVNGAQVTLNPSDLSALVPQQMVTVTIVAPFKQNSATCCILGSTLTLTAKATLIVE